MFACTLSLPCGVRFHRTPAQFACTLVDYCCRAVYAFTARLHCSPTRYCRRAVYVFAARLHYPPARCSTTTAVQCTPSQYVCTPAAVPRLLFAKFVFSSSTVHLQFIYCSTTVHRLHLLFIFCSSAIIIYYCGAPLMSSATLGRCSYCVRHRNFLVSR